jgi:hypothetical protein
MRLEEVAFAALTWCEFTATAPECSDSAVTATRADAMIFALAAGQADGPDLFVPTTLDPSAARTLTTHFQVQPPKVGYTKRSAQGWAYIVPFKIKDTETIEELIQRESQGAKISGADSGGIFSDGASQSHRGPRLYDAWFDVEVPKMRAGQSQFPIFRPMPSGWGTGRSVTLCTGGCGGSVPLGG